MFVLLFIFLHPFLWAEMSQVTLQPKKKKILKWLPYIIHSILFYNTKTLEKKGNQISRSRCKGSVNNDFFHWRKQRLSINHEMFWSMEKSSWFMRVFAIFLYNQGQGRWNLNLDTFQKTSFYIQWKNARERESRVIRQADGYHWMTHFHLHQKTQKLGEKNEILLNQINSLIKCEQVCRMGIWDGNKRSVLPPTGRTFKLRLLW